MRNNHLLIYCIICSAFIHFCLFQFDFTLTKNSKANFTDTTTEQGETKGSETAKTILGDFFEHDIKSVSANKSKSDALSKFLMQVRKHIENEKLISAKNNPSFIGNCTYRFKIYADDSFGEINLIESSGNKKLDSEALKSIKKASNKTKRPSSLAKKDLTISITIKYQYGM